MTRRTSTGIAFLYYNLNIRLCARFEGIVLKIFILDINDVQFLLYDLSQYSLKFVYKRARASSQACHVAKGYCQVGTEE